jgi:hypothetical protein
MLATTFIFLAALALICLGYYAIWKKTRVNVTATINASGELKFNFEVDPTERQGGGR